MTRRCNARRVWRGPQAAGSEATGLYRAFEAIGTDCGIIMVIPGGSDACCKGRMAAGYPRRQGLSTFWPRTVRLITARRRQLRAFDDRWRAESPHGPHRSMGHRQSLCLPWGYDDAVRRPASCRVPRLSPAPRLNRPASGTLYRAAPDHDLVGWCPVVLRATPPAPFPVVGTTAVPAGCHRTSGKDINCNPTLSCVTL